MIRHLRNNLCLSLMAASISLIFTLIIAAPVIAQKKAYVTDKCEITFRRGPGTDYKIVRLLKSGEAVEVIQEGEEGWAQVSLDDGSKGYVLLRLLTYEMPLSRKAEVLMEKSESLESETSKFREENETLKSENAQLKQELEQTRNQASTIEQQYNQLKLDSQDVLSLQTELTELREKHQDLEEKYRQARIETERKEDRHLWLIFGAAILAFGILIGVLSRRPSSRYGRPRLQ